MNSFLQKCTFKVILKTTGSGMNSPGLSEPLGLFSNYYLQQSQKLKNNNNKFSLFPLCPLPE